MIPTQYERGRSLFDVALDCLGEPRSGMRDLRVISRILATTRRDLRLVDSDVAQVVDMVAQPSEFLIQPGHAQRGGSHVDTAATRAQIHGRTDDRNMGMPHIPWCQVNLTPTRRCRL